MYYRYLKNYFWQLITVLLCWIVLPDHLHAPTLNQTFIHAWYFACVCVFVSAAAWTEKRSAFAGFIRFVLTCYNINNNRNCTSICNQEVPSSIRHQIIVKCSAITDAFRPILVAVVVVAVAVVFRVRECVRVWRSSYKLAWKKVKEAISPYCVVNIKKCMKYHIILLTKQMSSELLN